MRPCESSLPPRLDPVAPSPGRIVAVVAWGIAVLWLVYAAELIVAAGTGAWLPDWLGIRPRSWFGLVAILWAPLLHASWRHLLANSGCLLLLGGLAGWYDAVLARRAACLGWLLSGLAAWALSGSDGERERHIGASGIVCAWIALIIGLALRRSGWREAGLALVVVVLFSAAAPLCWPTVTALSSQISWQMHLGGLLAGCLVAACTPTRHGPSSAPQRGTAMPGGPRA